MNDLHYIQLKILKTLLFRPECSFTDLLKELELENNKLTFHLSQVSNLGYVSKDQTGKYILTEKGKEFANRMDTDKSQIMKQGKVGIIACCVNEEGESFQYLVYTRMKQPFYGSQGYPTGKVQYGETLVNAVTRELKEETNLVPVIKPELFLIEHHLVYSYSSKRLLEDKYFYFFKILNPSGELIANEEGKFEWVSEENLEIYVHKPFESIEKMFEVNKKMKNFDPARPYFNEVEVITDKF